MKLIPLAFLLLTGCYDSQYRTKNYVIEKSAVAVEKRSSLTVLAATHMIPQTHEVTAQCIETQPESWKLRVPCKYTVSPSGDIEFTWSPAFSGRVVIYGESR